MLQLICAGGWLPLVFVCLLSSACSSDAPMLLNRSGLPERVELADVPFFRLSDEVGGASALAAQLNHHEVIVSPGLVSTRIEQLPKSAAGANSPSALSAAARSYDMLVYSLPANLEALLTQVAAGQPVLLKLDEGFAGGDTEYANLVGFDQRQQIMLLRAGNNRRMHLPFKDFDKAWAEAGRWAVLVLPANTLPAQPDQALWLQGARDLQAQGRTDAAQRALRTAHKVWPDAQL
ncbi:peptidase C39 family protein [Pseudomonas sp. 5P_3.1_Bac2]|uniref:peptidase C39 family protein n=1 Tax=Pseudomonas sp. 5P_3.1_Bac2 TaxID=2971617 RepID=UPI0021C6BDED|nr:peptidase C39 family protein [Pseudomonas sp. 5P_3.1_Bac2]MCU1717356.1 peptidase C39 family protein [Pseudomonas sp. 5P_3.1_Bac2]